MINSIAIQKNNFAKINLKILRIFKLNKYNKNYKKFKF